MRADTSPELADVVTMGGALNLVPAICARILYIYIYALILYICIYIYMDVSFVMREDTSPELADVVTVGGALNLVPVLCACMCVFRTR